MKSELPDQPRGRWCVTECSVGRRSRYAVGRESVDLLERPDCRVRIRPIDAIHTNRQIMAAEEFLELYNPRSPVRRMRQHERDE